MLLAGNHADKGSSMARSATVAAKRPLIEIFDEAIDVVRQDAGEYGFVALVGAICACLAVLVPGLIGGPAGAAAVGPLLSLVALLSFGTGAALVSCAGDQLQPDAAGAFREALRRSPSLLRPWLLLMFALGVAGAGYSLGRAYLGPVPSGIVLLAPVAFAVWYAYPRSVAVTACIEQDLGGVRAERLSLAIAARAGGRLLIVWCALLAPTAAVLAISALGGLDAISGGFVALVFVATLPFAAAVLSPLFAEYASTVGDEARAAIAGTPAYRRGW